MPHYARFVAMIVLGVFALGGAVWRLWKPKKEALYEETALLTPDIRARLQALRDEDKFRADDTITPPYPGPKGPKRHIRLNEVINALLTDILNEPDGPLEASDLAARMGLSVAALAKKADADIHRANGYMLEIWYLFGFRSEAGYFSPADGGPVPEGWSEPLPPGWTAPDAPRTPQPPVNPPGAPSRSQGDTPCPAS